MTHRARLLLPLCLLLMFATITQASLGEQIETLGIAYDYSVIVDAAVDGSFTYAISSIALYVFDTTDPANPMPYSTVPLPTGGYWVATIGEYVYVGSFSVFHIYTKVSSLYREPQYVTSVHLDTPIRTLDGILTLVGPDQTTLCFHNDDYGITMLDVAQPASPVPLGVYGQEDIYYHQIAGMGEYLLATAYGVDLPFELRVMDISDPAVPQVIGAIQIPGNLARLEVVGDTIYALFLDGAGGFTHAPHIVVINASDPTDLHVSGEFIATDNLTRMMDTAFAVHDGRAIICDDIFDFQIGDLRIVDVVDPADMYQVSFLEGVASRLIQYNGDYAYLTYMRVLDISDPSNPQVTQNVEPISDSISDFCIYQGYGYVATEWGGLTVLDMTDPLHPDTIAWLDVPAIGGIYPYGQHLYLPDMYGFGLSVANISDPQLPVLLEDWDIDAILPLRMMDPLCWFRPGWEQGGFDLVDCHDPTDPEIVGENPCSARTSAIPYQDYIVGSDGISLVVVDNSDPWNPTDLVFHTMSNGELDALGVWDQYAFAMNGDNCFTSLDLSDPTDPTELQTIEFSTVNRANLRAVHDGFAYIDLNSELHVFNVSNPENMIETGWIVLPDTPYGLDITEDGYLYVELRDGVLICDVSLALGVEEWPGSRTSLTPAQFTLSPAYPNPFNAATVFSVTLPAPSQLDLGVFNVNGQQVTSLFTGQRAAGEHQFSFDASNLASGVYFLRATASDQFTATQKVMLVR